VKTRNVVVALPRRWTGEILVNPMTSVSREKSVVPKKTVKRHAKTGKTGEMDWMVRTGKMGKMVVTESMAEMGKMAVMGKMA